MPLVCPACRATNSEPPVCRRCKADLRLPWAVETRRAFALAVARRDHSLPHAEECHALRPADDSRQTLAALRLLAGDFDGAFSLGAAP